MISAGVPGFRKRAADFRCECWVVSIRGACAFDLPSLT